MYEKYLSFVSNINIDNIKTNNFKSNDLYRPILEHVSKDLGIQYLILIEKEFNYIPFQNILEFVNLNDTFGFPNKEAFEYKNGKVLNCSPTSLRYLYHSLVILNYYKDLNLKSMVEVGCGYGGLFLAINYFSNLLNIDIINYHIIDFREVGYLIKNYINVNKSIFNVKINFFIHNNDEFKETLLENDLFFISNYCFTEISEINRINYIENLFDKIKNGFITWQTVFGLDINSTGIIKIPIKKIEEEKPQTATLEKKNYFVYF